METPLTAFGAGGDLADPLLDLFGEELDESVRVGFGSVATARTLPARLRDLTVVLGNGRHDGNARRMVSIPQETSCGAAASMAEPSSCCSCSSSGKQWSRELEEGRERTELTF